MEVAHRVGVALELLGLVTINIGPPTDVLPNKHLCIKRLMYVDCLIVRHAESNPAAQNV